jgi:hypothetical protein
MFEKATNKIVLEENSPIGVKPCEGGSEVLFGDTLIKLSDDQAKGYLACLEAAYGTQLKLPLPQGKSLTSKHVRDYLMEQTIQKTHLQQPIPTLAELAHAGEKTNTLSHGAEGKQMKSRKGRRRKQK